MLGSTEFQDIVGAFHSEAIPEAVAAAKEGDETAQMQVVAAAVWAAFACPAGMGPLYDSIATVWLGHGDMPYIPTELPRVPIDQALWDEFWPALELAKTVTYTPWTLVARVAAIARHTHPDFLALANDGAVRRFGWNLTFGAALEPEVDCELWTASLPDTLGRTLAQMVTDGVYDVEMGTIRELRELPPHLQRVHAQADGLEGVWRTVAGYDTTDSHLLAFSAFQLAQCGHLFAASALALFASLAQFVVPNSLPVLLLLISEGWRHGKETPSLLPITWRPHWGEPIEPIRARYAIPTYRSLFNKNLIHALRLDTPPLEEDSGE